MTNPLIALQKGLVFLQHFTMDIKDFDGFFFVIMNKITGHNY